MRSQAIMSQLLSQQLRVEQGSVLIVIMSSKGFIKIQEKRTLIKRPTRLLKETKAE